MLSRRGFFGLAIGAAVASKVVKADPPVKSWQYAAIPFLTPDQYRTNCSLIVIDGVELTGSYDYDTRTWRVIGYRDIDGKAYGLGIRVADMDEIQSAKKRLVELLSNPEGWMLHHDFEEIHYVPLHGEP